MEYQYINAEGACSDAYVWQAVQRVIAIVEAP